MDLRVLIDGLGLMGGSLAAAFSTQGATVYCHHRRPEVAREAEAKGWGSALDHLDPSLDIDIAITCVPVDVVPQRVTTIHQTYPTALITDVGSTKGRISEQLRTLELSGNFIGSHPMCGSHAQGLAAATADLYRGATVVLCPHESTPSERIKLLRCLWEACGGQIIHLGADEHDRVVARVSHVPHILAAVAATRLDDESLPLAASGFRDTTRVAAGSPELWNSILQENRGMVTHEIDSCIQDLEHLRDALNQGFDEDVTKWLAKGQAQRLLFEHYQVTKNN